MTIDLYGGSHAAVEIEPAPGRWPEHEAADRISLPVGLAGLALARAEAAAAARVRARLMALGLAIAAEPGDGDDPGDWTRTVAGATLVPSEGPGDPRIVVQTVRSAVGPVPTLGRALPSSLALSAAAAAAAAACLEGRSLNARLGAALAVEGLLGWYRLADPNLQPPQQALAYALRYAAARLEEAGREVPAGLAQAVAAHRQLSPMAGG